MTEEEKNHLLKEYFCAVVEEDVMTTNKMGRLFLDGEELSADEMIRLQQEADYFANSRLASILWNSLYSQAQKIMFENSEDFDDMRNGKMMMYNISVQKNIVDKIIKWKPLPK